MPKLYDMKTKITTLAYYNLFLIDNGFMLVKC